MTDSSNYSLFPIPYSLPQRTDFFSKPYLADEVAVSSFFTEEFLNLHEVVISPIIRIELLSFAGL